MEKQLKPLRCQQKNGELQANPDDTWILDFQPPDPWENIE